MRSQEDIKILIIDDDPVDAKLLRRALSGDKSLSFITAESLGEGLEAVTANPNLDLVMLDLTLPDSRGMETVRKYLKHAGHVPVIVITGLDSNEVGMQAIQEGAQDFIIKGKFNRDALSRCIHYAIERKGLDRLKDDFISMASHELKTPIAIIKTGVANLTNDKLGPLTEPQAKVIDIIDKTSLRLGRLIENILDISRLKSGISKPQRAVVEASQLMDAALSGFAQLAEEKQVVIEYHAIAESCNVSVDVDMITQVVSNLMSNALRYATERIVVCAKKSQRNSRDCVTVSVANNGSFLSEEDIAQLFQKFVQIRRPQGGADYKGTGLGLAICTEIIDQHDGDMWIESEEGGMTTFFFTLPVES